LPIRHDMANIGTIRDPQADGHGSWHPESPCRGMSGAKSPPNSRWACVTGRGLGCRNRSPCASQKSHLEPPGTHMDHKQAEDGVWPSEFGTISLLPFLQPLGRPGSKLAADDYRLGQAMASCPSYWQAPRDI
jgi:hypothetical protein